MLFNIAGEDYQVPTLWEIVRDLRKRVMTSLKDFPNDIRDAAALTATELAENLVKYAVQDPDDPPRLSVAVQDGHLTIQSQNRIESEIHANHVLSTVERIAEHEDPMELYANAIAETLERRTTGSQQGFYRIAAIGGFTIRAQLQDTCLTIVATRSLS